MKKGWQTRKLGEMLEVQNGYAFSSKDYSESGHFVMRIGNVQNGFISLADPKYIQLPANGALERFALAHGDILVSLTGNVGRVGVIQKAHLPAALNQRIARISIRRDSPATREFLLFFLFSDSFREGLSGAGRGAAQQNVSTRDLVEIAFSVPSLSEQQRIVGLLDEAFASLATAQAHAAQNLQNARALFESCIQVEFGKDVALGELVDIKTGKLDANAAEEDGEYPFFTCSRETYAINNYAFDCEAVLLAGNNAVGDFNVKHYVGKFNAYQRTYVITINSRKRAISRYLYYQLQKNLAKFKSQSVGTGTKFLKLGMIKDMMIPLPTIPEQSRIVNQLDALAAETQRLAQIYEQKLAALAALKKSLLHQAFSGEL
jgi:type I restriction enzyme S subunit